MEGKIVIPLTYDGAGYFGEGLRVVENDRRFLFVDKTGKVVIYI